jgi:hypothetical protein
LEARLRSAREGLRRLDKVAERHRAAPAVVDRLREKYQHRIHRLAAGDAGGHAELDKRDASAYKRLRLEVINAERAEVIRLRDEGEISDDVLRRIQQGLDLKEVLLSASGARAERADSDGGRDVGNNSEPGKGGEAKS